MRKLMVLPLVLTAGLVSFTANATAAPPELDAKLLNRMLDEVRAAGAPAVLTEVRAGEETFGAARGPREPGHSAPTRPTDRVRIASVTKSMVSTVVLQLVAEHRLRLDERIGRYLPGLLPYPEPITIRQLLGHTSGIPEYILDDIYPSVDKGSAEDVRTNRYLRFTPRQLIALATDRPLLFAPGKGFSYSNANYVLLGMLIEKLTGHSAEHEVTHRVLRPAGMRHSYIPRTNPHIAGPHPRGNYATGEPNQPLLDSTDMAPSQFWAAGFVISTMDDLNRFYRAMFDGTLLSSRMLTEARTFNKVWQGKYGLGVLGLDTPPGCEPVPGGVAYGHTGGAMGYTTYSFSSADGGRQFTLSYSLDSTLDPVATERIGKAVQDFGAAAMCS